jgi:hypothetical protein
VNWSGWSAFFDYVKLDGFSVINVFSPRVSVGSSNAIATVQRSYVSNEVIWYKASMRGEFTFDHFIHLLFLRVHGLSWEIGRDCLSHRSLDSSSNIEND